MIAEGTTSGVTITDEIAVIGLVITVVTLVAGYVVSYLIRRRTSAGKVTTSAADTLWAQAQSMREMLLAEKEKAEEQLDRVAEQRDRLLSSQATQILPMLTAINESLSQIATGIGTVLAKVDEILEHRRAATHRQDD